MSPSRGPFDDSPLGSFDNRFGSSSHHDGWHDRWNDGGRAHGRGPKGPVTTIVTGVLALALVLGIWALGSLSDRAASFNETRFREPRQLSGTAMLDRDAAVLEFPIQAFNGNRSADPTSQIEVQVSVEAFGGATPPRTGVSTWFVPGRDRSTGIEGDPVHVEIVGAADGHVARFTLADLSLAPVELDWTLRGAYVDSGMVAVTADPPRDQFGPDPSHTFHTEGEFGGSPLDAERWTITLPDGDARATVVPKNKGVYWRAAADHRHLGGHDSDPGGLAIAAPEGCQAGCTFDVVVSAASVGTRQVLHLYLFDGATVETSPVELVATVLEPEPAVLSVPDLANGPVDFEIGLDGWDDRHPISSATAVLVIDPTAGTADSAVEPFEVAGGITRDISGRTLVEARSACCDRPWPSIEVPRLSPDDEPAVSVRGVVWAIESVEAGLVLRTAEA